MAVEFRLEKLLWIKKLYETQAVERLASSRDALEICTRFLDELALARQEICQMIIGGRPGELSGEEFGHLLQQIDLLADQTRAALERHRVLEVDHQKCRQEAQARVAERQAHEKLKERCRQRWVSEDRKRQLRKMDEAGAHRRAPAREEADHE
jgi:flagellar export protein FliJ